MTEPTPDPNADRSAESRLYLGQEESPGLAAPEIVATALTLLWLGLVGTFFLLTDGSAMPGGTLGVVMTVVSVFVPVALIWVAAVLARTARGMRAEARRLHSSIDAMRAAYVSQLQAGAARPAAERKVDELAQAQRQAESAMATFASRRDGATLSPTPSRKYAASSLRDEAAGDEQPALALGATPDDLKPPVGTTDLIRALNFPDNPDDRDGFRALRSALDDRAYAKLIRAAQDVLTLLSEDGIYMDDLSPDRARPEIWRRFAQGERGRAIAGLGGVRDRSSLALSAGRMRQDTIFRDAAHHFLRTFDKAFAEFEKGATDQEVADIAETRTARAFMLLGRVTGIFD